MAKKVGSSAKRASSSAKSSAKRDLVRRPGASAYAKRKTTGRFSEMDDVGRSQKVDKRKTAKKKVSSGYGDQGDLASRSRKKR